MPFLCFSYTYLSASILFPARYELAKEEYSVSTKNNLLLTWRAVSFRNARVFVSPADIHSGISVLNRINTMSIITNETTENPKNIKAPNELPIIIGLSTRDFNRMWCSSPTPLSKPLNMALFIPLFKAALSSNMQYVMMVPTMENINSHVI